MTSKALHNLILHYASDLTAHSTLSLALTLSSSHADSLPVPQGIRHLLNWRTLHLLLFLLNAFLDMNMGQPLTCFRFYSNATLSENVPGQFPLTSPALFFSLALITV